MMTPPFSMYDQKAGAAAGKYTLEVVHTVSGKDEEDGREVTIHRQERVELEFTVDASRFRLRDSDDVYACFPPVGSSGAYDSVVPHVILRRPMLPWCRLLVPGNSDKVPWMALLVLGPDELDATQGGMPVKFERTAASALCPGEPGDGALWGWNKQKQECPLSNSEAQEQIDTVEMDATVFLKICPGADELQLLAHVRAVDTSDKEDPEPSPPSGRRVSATVAPPAAESTKQQSPEPLVAEFAVLMANRFVQPGRNMAVLVSLEGWKTWLPKEATRPAASELENKRVRLVVLHSWQFQSIDQGGSFQQRVKTLYESADLLRVSEELRKKIDDPALSTLCAQGYTPIPYHSEGSEAPTLAWYRGPLVPNAGQPFPDNSTSFSCADSALIVSADGQLDISYSAAWQLGRLLAQSSPAFMRAATVFLQPDDRGQHFRLEDMPGYLRTFAGTIRERTAQMEALEAMADWLGDLVLLRPVPLRYLIPSDKLLPRESLRLFTIDMNWLDAMTDGAFSVGADLLCESSPQVPRSRRRELLWTLALQAGRKRRKKELLSEEMLKQQSSGSIALFGFLIRSTVLSSWPGIELRVYASDERTARTVLRQQLLSEGVLLVVVDGPPHVIELHEPREGLRFGAATQELTLRAIDSSGEVPDGKLLTPKVRLSEREGSGRVIDVRAVAKAAHAAIQESGQKITEQSSTMQSSVSFTLPFLYEPTHVRGVLQNKSSVPSSDWGTK